MLCCLKEPEDILKCLVLSTTRQKPKDDESINRWSKQMTTNTIALCGYEMYLTGKYGMS